MPTQCYYVTVEKISDDFSPLEMAGCFVLGSMTITDNPLHVNDLLSSKQLTSDGDGEYDVSKSDKGPFAHVSIVIKGTADCLLPHELVRILDHRDLGTITGLQVTGAELQPDGLIAYTLESAAHPRKGKTSKGEAVRVAMLYRMLQWAAGLLKK